MRIIEYPDAVISRNIAVVNDGMILVLLVSFSDYPMEKTTILLIFPGRKTSIKMEPRSVNGTFLRYF